LNFLHALYTLASSKVPDKALTLWLPADTVRHPRYAVHRSQQS